jgi:hypothetical protein
MRGRADRLDLVDAIRSATRHISGLGCPTVTGLGAHGGFPSARIEARSEQLQKVSLAGWGLDRPRPAAVDRLRELHPVRDGYSNSAGCDWRIAPTPIRHRRR